MAVYDLSEANLLALPTLTRDLVVVVVVAEDTFLEEARIRIVTLPQPAQPEQYIPSRLHILQDGLHATETARLRGHIESRPQLDGLRPLGLPEDLQVRRAARRCVPPAEPAARGGRQGRHQRGEDSFSRREQLRLCR